MKKCDDLLQTNQHFDVAFHWVSGSSMRDYFTRPNGSIDVARILAKQGLPFRDHDESKESLNNGNFRELCEFAKEQNPSLKRQQVKTNQKIVFWLLLKYRGILCNVLQRKGCMLF
jgi:hypothetical protein